MTTNPIAAAILAAAESGNRRSITIDEDEEQDDEMAEIQDLALALLGDMFQRDEDGQCLEP